VLLVVSRPLTWWKILLTAAMAASYVVISLIDPLRDFFQLVFTSVSDVWLVAAVGVVIAGVAIALVPVVVPGLGHQTEDRPDHRADDSVAAAE
jgi:cation-transporting ATPase E